MDMGLKDTDGIDEASGRTSEATEDDVDDDDNDDASETSLAVKKKEKKEKKKRVYGMSLSLLPSQFFSCPSAFTR